MPDGAPVFGGMPLVEHRYRTDSGFGYLALAQDQPRNAQRIQCGSYQQQVSEGYSGGWTISGRRAMAAVMRSL